VGLGSGLDHGYTQSQSSNDQSATSATSVPDSSSCTLLTLIDNLHFGSAGNWRELRLLHKTPGTRLFHSDNTSLACKATHALVVPFSSYPLQGSKSSLVKDKE